MTNRFCADCKFFIPATGHQSETQAIRFGKCLKVRDPASAGIEFLAPGMDSEIEYRYATSMRASESKCGPDAKWFEPKSEEKAA